MKIIWGGSRCPGCFRLLLYEAPVKAGAFFVDEDFVNTEFPRNL